MTYTYSVEYDEQNQHQIHAPDTEIPTCFMKCRGLKDFVQVCISTSRILGFSCSSLPPYQQGRKLRCVSYADPRPGCYICRRRLIWRMNKWAYRR